LTRKNADAAGVARRVRIAEAALRVLSVHGARGLTHRAVDESARLPIGSTSYYLRTRDALMAAAAARLCELDERDVVAASARGGIPALLEQWASPSHRRRLVARFELFLEATRNPSMRKLIREQRAGFLRAAQRAFERAGHPDAALRGELLVATIDGLLLARLFDTRGSKRPQGSQPPSTAALLRMFAAC
jgi:DNA-binding transcriptional regulator YbjK